MGIYNSWLFTTDREKFHAAFSLGHKSLINNYSTSACLYETLTKYREFSPTRTVTIFGEHRINGSYTMMAKPIRNLE